MSSLNDSSQKSDFGSSNNLFDAENDTVERIEIKRLPAYPYDLENLSLNEEHPMGDVRLPISSSSAPYVSKFWPSWNALQARSTIIPQNGSLLRPTYKKKLGEKEEFTRKKYLRDRVASTLYKDEWSDVHFIFETPTGHKRLPANSYILAISSEVFRVQFRSEFKYEEEIALVDVNYEAFKILLKYLYTDKLDLTADNALDVLYAARKYMIDSLIDATLEFLSSQLTADNVCNYLAQQKLFDDDILFESCRILVAAQAEKVLQSDGFKELPLEMVKLIVSRDDLAASENAIYEALLDWGLEYCRREGLEPTKQTVREVLGDTLNEVRFPLMDVETFADGPAVSELFQKPQTPFKSIPRTGPKLHTCRRFHTSSSRVNQWRYRDKCDAVQFSVDRRIFLTGVSLYGSSDEKCKYNVRMELKATRTKEMLEVAEKSYKCSGINTMCSVFWDRPIQIEADTFYTIAIVIATSPYISYFGQDGQSEVSVKSTSNPPITFTFDTSTESSNGTGVLGGQIPELHFYA